MTKTFSSSNSSRSPMPSATRRGTYHCLPLSLDSDDSTLISYFRSGSGSPMSLTSPVLSDKFSFNYSRSGSSSSGSVRTPRSPLDNVKTAPAVADEEVLVIDGVLVSSSSSSNSSSSGNGVVYKKKMELCRSWEEFGRCRFASNCQFAHGKEELHPSYFPIKNKAMEQWLQQAKLPSLAYLNVPTLALLSSNLCTPATTVPPQSLLLTTFAEDKNTVTKARLPTLNLKTLIYSLIQPPSQTAGLHWMTAFRLLCLLKLTNAHQRKKLMPIFIMFSMVQLHIRGYPCLMNFALDGDAIFSTNAPPFLMT